MKHKYFNLIILGSSLIFITIFTNFLFENYHSTETVNSNNMENLFGLRNQDAFLEWSSPLGVPGDSVGLIGSPAIVDVDNDGMFEVILGSNNSLRCFNGVDGSEKWIHSTTSPLAKSSPVVSDLDQDGQQEIVYGSGGNHVECVNASTGIREWINTDAGSGCQTIPAVGDIDNDGQMEVIFGCNDDKVYCINGETGAEEWSYTTFGYVRSSPAIGDIDEDGDLEVVVGSDDNHVYCLNGTGGLEWSYISGGDIWFNPIIIADTNDDSHLEVIFGCNDGKVYCLYGSSGTLKWSSSTYSSFISVAPIVDDVNDDGKVEVIIGCSNSYVYCLNGDTGSQIWEFDTGSSAVRCSPTIGDVDADDEKEVLIGSDNNKLHCLNGMNGQEEWAYSVGGCVRSRPRIADIDNDGLTEILFGSDESYLYCITTNSPFLDGVQIIFEKTLEYLNTIIPLETDLGLQINCSITNSSSLNWVYLCENSTGSFVNRSMKLGKTSEWTYNVDLANLTRGDSFVFSFHANQTPNTIIKNDNNGFNFTMRIGDFFPPVITFEKSLEYLNATYFDETIEWLEINCTVTDRTAIKWVFLCENSTETYLNHSMVLGLNGEWTFVLKISDLNQDEVLGFLFYACDEFNNTGLNNNGGLLYTLDFNVPIASDHILPKIIINSPSMNEIFGQYSPAFDLTIIEENLNITWYSLDSGLTRVFFTGLTGTIDQALWEQLPAGHVTIIFFAKDLNANIGARSVTIIKEIVEIPGYSIMMLLGIIGIFTLLTVRILNQKGLKSYKSKE